MNTEDPFITGLRQLFEENPDLKPATVSDAAGLNKSAIRKMFEGRVKSPRHQSMSAIATVLGVTVDDIISRTAAPRERLVIAVAGRVGAGAAVDLVDDHAHGDGLFKIVRPPQISSHGVVGVEVVGDSMAPIYQPGDVLIYSREAMGVPSEAVGRICICEDADGRAWVKQVRAGSEPGLFHLISANPTGTNMHDVALKWAAPVRLHLPVEFVERV